MISFSQLILGQASRLGYPAIPCPQPDRPAAKIPAGPDAWARVAEWAERVAPDDAEAAGRVIDALDTELIRRGLNFTAPPPKRPRKT